MNQDKDKFDEKLDKIIKNPPVDLYERFTEDTIQRIREEEKEHTRFFGIPKWAIAIGGIATACLVGVFAFQVMINQAIKDEDTLLRYVGQSDSNSIAYMIELNGALNEIDDILYDDLVYDLTSETN